MYRCEICGCQSEPNETQFNLITKKNKLEKGWEIAEGKRCCCKCYTKSKE